jgi:hypothetical protein
MQTRAQEKALMETRARTRAVCEAAWKEGMPLKITSDGFPIIMKPSMNCEYRVQGTQDIAYVGLPKTKEEVLAFLATIPRLSVRDLASAPQGVYTWLLYSTEGGPQQFVASKTETMLELGTVHYSIAMSVGATRVHGAGELWKHGGAYTANFLSGTFMQSWVLPEPCTLKTMERFLRDKLQTQVLPELFRGKTLTFSDSAFVTDRFLKNELTTDKLETYVRHGFTVCIHDASAKAECKRIKGTCEKPVTLETMKGGTLSLQGQRIPMTPRKAYLNRTSSEDGAPSQAALARQVFASRGLLENPRTPKELALAALKRPISPGSVGLGRKTKKAKKGRRKTRRRHRGGDDLDPNHVGVRMAEGLLGPPPLIPMFERLKAELKLTDAQVDTMIRAYSEAAEDGVYPEEGEFRRYLIHRFKLNTRS